MRRLFAPLVILAVTITAGVLTQQADDAADPGDPPATAVADSLGTPVLSVRRAPEWLRRPTTDGQLAAAARLVLDGAGVPDATCLSVLRDGEVIADHLSGVGLVPAGLQRLVIIAALDGLGADSVFTTEVVRSAEGAIEEGVLTGDIYLIGGGDPVLATADYTARFGDDRVSTSLEVLADQVAAELRLQGIQQINGAVIADDSKYTPIEYDYEFDGTWSPTDNDANIVGPLSALMVNDGYEWDPDTESITRAANPAIEAASVFEDLLEDRGLEITDPALAGTQPDFADQVSIAAIDSDPLTLIATRALIDGTTAEMLLKEIGVRAGAGAARRDAAFQGVLLNLIDAGLPLEQVFPADGSGLSLVNRVTCDLLVAILALDRADSLVDAVLPDIADSALSACSPDNAGQMRVMSAASGLTTALTGRYTAENGDIVTFALIANEDADPVSDPDTDPDLDEAPPSFEPCNPLQRSLLEAITGHPYGPDLDVFAPLPVTDAPTETVADP